jgi:AraC family transcriptional regulator
MEVRIETVSEKKLIGNHLTMSLMDNRTAALWKSFMPRRKEIINAVATDLFAVQIYNENYFQNFNPANIFVKWATMEVRDFSNVPDGMETLAIPAGSYAVFLHRGPASEGPKTFQYIFGTWLPKSNYLLDIRPHFEILGDKYKNEDPSSEEEIWIPIRHKA